MRDGLRSALRSPQAHDNRKRDESSERRADDDGDVRAVHDRMLRRFAMAA
jgi:hypothetical protein